MVDLDRFGQTIPCEDCGEGVDEGVPPPPPPAPQVSRHGAPPVSCHHIPLEARYTNPNNCATS